MIIMITVMAVALLIEIQNNWDRKLISIAARRHVRGHQLCRQLLVNSKSRSSKLLGNGTGKFMHSRSLSSITGALSLRCGNNIMCV